MKVAVVQFPGSNCDQDALWALQMVGLKAELVWHTARNLEGFQAVLLPGGFSYGDYLRAGALAKFSPVMQEVRRLAERGHPVVGICNGFQVLTEAGLLPGRFWPTPTCTSPVRGVSAGRAHRPALHRQL